MLEPKKVSVNGRSYTVTMFDPLTAFDFFVKLESKDDGAKKSIAKQVFGQCRTPDMGKSLADEAVFQEHFAKYPEDMLPLMGEATGILTAPFVGKRSDTSGIAGN